MKFIVQASSKFITTHSRNVQTIPVRLPTVVSFLSPYHGRPLSASRIYPSDGRHYHTSLPYLDGTTAPYFSPSSSETVSPSSLSFLTNGIPTIPLATLPNDTTVRSATATSSPYKRYVRILSLDIILNPKPSYRKKETSTLSSPSVTLATSLYVIRIQPRYITIHNSRILREIGTHRLVNVGIRTENFYSTDTVNAAIELTQEQIFRYGIGLRIIRSQNNTGNNGKDDYEYFIPEENLNWDTVTAPNSSFSINGRSTYLYHWRWLCGKYGDERWFGLLVNPNPSGSFRYTRPEILRNWHIPMTENKNRMTIYKYQARMDLLFSKTLPIAQGIVKDGKEMKASIPSTKGDNNDHNNHRFVPSDTGTTSRDHTVSPPVDNPWSFHTFGTIPTVDSSMSSSSYSAYPTTTGTFTTRTPYEELEQKDKDHQRLMHKVSASLPTVTILKIHDIYSPSSSSSSDSILMTDGCAPAGSLLFDAALRSLPDPYGEFMKENGYEKFTGSLVSSSVSSSVATKPSVIQGRLGGYKGVWYRDPACSIDTITVRPSQEKIKYSFSSDQPSSNQLQFELIKYNKDNGISSLNRQFALLLEGWGVPSRVFLQYLDSYTHSIKNMTNDPVAALQSLNPHSLLWMEQQSIQMIQHGLWSEFRLMDNLRKLQKLRLTQLQKRVHVPLPQSRTVFILADPTGLLREGEIYYRCSNYTVKDDPIHMDRLGTSRTSYTVEGDVILLRNPCYHPDHLVVAKGIKLSERMMELGIQNTNELKENRTMLSTPYTLAQVMEIENTLVDVIVMPIHGTYCMAARLSGGDYDGDTAWICWNKDIVYPVHQKYHRRSKSNVSPTKTNIVTRTVTECEKPSNLASTPSDKELQVLWQASYQYRMDLGIASNLHTAYLDKLLTDENRHRYRGTPAPESTALWHPTVQYLSHICDLAVDIPKLGHNLPVIEPSLRSIPYPAYLRYDKDEGNYQRKYSRSPEHTTTTNTSSHENLRTAESESVWGQLYQKIKQLQFDNLTITTPRNNTKEESSPSAPTTNTSWLPFPSFTFGMITDTLHSSFSSPPLSPIPTKSSSSLSSLPQPHPLIIECANHYQYWKYRNEAMHHRIMFNQDTINYQKIWKISSRFEKSNVNYSSGEDSSIDENSSAEDYEFHGGTDSTVLSSPLSSHSSTTSHRQWLRERNRTRFLMKPTASNRMDQYIERDTTERIGLALAYYMVTWESWFRVNQRNISSAHNTTTKMTRNHSNSASSLSSSSSISIDIRSNNTVSSAMMDNRQRFSPPSFPWIIADDYILLGIQQMKLDAAEPPRRNPPAKS